MYRSVFALLVMIQLVSCASDNECLSEVTGSEPISVTSVTKATEGGTSSYNFETDEIVWLWAKKTSDDSEYIKAWKLHADGNGRFSGSEKYWPSDGSLLNVYALHGNFNNSITEGSTSWSTLTSLTHTVETDQSSDANKRLSDLLYSHSSNAVALEQPVPLTFDHVLSKLCITLKKAEGSGIEDTNLKNAKIEVSNINTVVTYDATANTISSSGTPTTITLGQENSESTTYEAIVPSGMTVTPSVKITLNNFPVTGKTRTFSCNLSNVTFAKGNKYTFTLTLHNEIVVSAPTIKAWTKDSDTKVTIPQASVDSN